ncbi:helicase associated domain-containing protein [Streptomyces avidinii]|uniref:helicase associated domain-containing protein n=1 Tax=Streptomyces avidinii TaxID=1895 RepID=UPI0037B86DE4
MQRTRGGCRHRSQHPRGIRGLIRPCRAVRCWGSAAQGGSGSVGTASVPAPCTPVNASISPPASGSAFEDGSAFHMLYTRGEPRAWSLRGPDRAGTFPLARWLSDQRRAYRAGTMTGERAAELEELGIVWDTADAAFEQNLGAARAYYQVHRTLAAPPGASPSSTSPSGSARPTSDARADSAKPPAGRSGGPPRSPRSTPTGTRVSGGGRSTGNATTRTSPTMPST